jgi:hypothetical protein
MKYSFVLSIICAVAVATFVAPAVRADDIGLDLEYDTFSQTWELYAEVVSPGSGATDGSNGIAGMVALINNIDFGTNGDAVNIASGINAFFPNGNQPVLDKGGSLIEILYGQDISDPNDVVGLVGVGGRDLLADGTYSGSIPSFGIGSDGNFLGATVPAVQTGALAADGMVLTVINVTVVFDPADLNEDGLVDGLDLGIQLGNWGQNVTPDQGELNASFPVNGLDLGILLAAWSPPPLSAVSAVPEPTTFSLLAFACASMLTLRRRHS